MPFLVYILPFESGSVDPHIFADPDSESQILADPTDPDPKHCKYGIQSSSTLTVGQFLDKLSTENMEKDKI